MSLRSLLAIALAAAALGAAPALAAADEAHYGAIDSVAAVDAANSAGWHRYGLELTGVLDAGGGAVTKTYFAYTDNDQGKTVVEQCQRAATIVLSRPGRFRLDVTYQPSGSSSYVTRCRLSRID